MRALAPAGICGGVPEGWGVRRAARLAFPAQAALASDAAHTERLRTYLTDLLLPYGLTLDAELPGAGAQSYGEMAEALVRAAVPPGERVDLLVLAHRVPDITPGRATAAWLSHVCPGHPLSFAVTDDPAAAFTALRLVHAYAAGAGLTRALLLVVEQPSLPYSPAVAPPLPDTAYGVALLLGPPAPGERPPVAVSLPHDGTAALAGAPGAVTAIVPPSLPVPPVGADRVRVASAARPATGVWWELAGELAQSAEQLPASPRRLLLADARTTPPGRPPEPTASSPTGHPAAPEPRVALAAFDVLAVSRPAVPAVPAGGSR